MAPVYKLKYSDLMGVAEPIRYLLAYGEIKYENVEIKDNIDWIEEKRCKCANSNINLFLIPRLREVEIHVKTSKNIQQSLWRLLDIIGL